MTKRRHQFQDLTPETKTTLLGFEGAHDAIVHEIFAVLARHQAPMFVHITATFEAGITVLGASLEHVPATDRAELVADACRFFESQARRYL